MSKNEKEITIKALELYKKELDKVYEKVCKKCDKEQEKIKSKISAMSEYSSEDDIMDMYGYGCITEKKKDELIDMFRKIQSDSQSMLEENTPLTEYRRILRSDIKQIEAELTILKQELKDSELETL